MDAFTLYKQWQNTQLEDSDLVEELAQIEGNETEIYERFYTDLTFGTAGLRGKIGAGTNCMNIYTVRRATQGICSWLRQHKEGGSAAIAYDSRNKSKLFAEATACVFAANGVKVYLYSELTPTPMLSWAVRYYGCDTGVVITASHNPAEYNGYKAYDESGCQITSDMADGILSCILKTDLFTGVKTMAYDDAIKAGLIVSVDDAAINAYFEQVRSCRCFPDAVQGADLKLVYTPLNGTGNLPVRRILSEIGIDDPILVKEQLLPDGNFPTCRYPNPEFKEALLLGLKLAEETKADLLIGTDPDADRVGAAVRHNGEYVQLGGNDVGVLLTDYIAHAKTVNKTMPERPVVIKSIVTTTLTDLVANSYGIEVRDVLTGFKNIGTEIANLEAAGELSRLIFAYEESCGYLAGPYVRDKDAIVTTMLVAEMAAYYKKAGKTLIDVMEDIHKRFGYFCNHVTNTMFPGADGMKKMTEIMDKLFAAPPKVLAGYNVATCCDYRSGICVKGGQHFPTGLPTSDVLSLTLEDGNVVVIRPSGTEPKLKTYYIVKSQTMAQAKEICDVLAAAVYKLLGF